MGRENRRIIKGTDGSAYLGFYAKYGHSLGSEGFTENVAANPDVLSEENGFNPWKQEQDEDNDELLGAYYRALANGVLATLSARERAVWKLVFFENLSENKAAEKLGVNRSTIRTHLKTAGPKILRAVTKERRRKWTKK